MMEWIEMAVQATAKVAKTEDRTIASDIVRPRRLLNLEGAAALGFGIVAFAQIDVTWWLFGILLLAPDLSMLTIPLGKRISSFSYNVFHTYASPALLGLVGFLIDEKLPLAIAAIWVCHIGLDRTIGYGLKYAGKEFKETHIQEV
jgi:hypothetical protein